MKAIEKLAALRQAKDKLKRGMADKGITPMQWQQIIQDIVTLIQHVWPLFYPTGGLQSRGNHLTPADVQADLDALNQLEQTLVGHENTLEEAQSTLITAQGNKDRAQAAVDQDTSSIQVALQKLLTDAQDVYGGTTPPTPPPAPAPAPEPVQSKLKK